MHKKVTVIHPSKSGIALRWTCRCINIRQLERMITTNWPTSLIKLLDYGWESCVRQWGAPNGCANNPEGGNYGGYYRFVVVRHEETVCNADENLLNSTVCKCGQSWIYISQMIF